MSNRNLTVKALFFGRALTVKVAGVESPCPEFSRRKTYC
jgi:hypothetical protein